MRGRVLLAALLMAVALVLTACGGGSGEAEEHFYAGVELADQGRFQEAIAQYDESIQLDSDHAEAYINRGTLYFQIGQPGRSIQDFDNAIRLEPDLAIAYSNRGAAYDALDQNERAIGLLFAGSSRATILNPIGLVQSLLGIRVAF